jgi:aspartate aminotransferase
MTGRITSTDLDLPIRPAIKNLQHSLIREIAHEGMGKSDVIPLWFGEPDLPTPDFIIAASDQALREGKTFYTPNLGIPELRATLSSYMSSLYAKAITDDRVVITAAAMNGMMLLAEALINPGNNVVAVTPVWPNFFRCIEIMGGEVRMSALSPSESGWSIDLDKLFDACNNQTRAIYVNTPGNPTGWVMNHTEMQVILDFCRKRRIWIISDEVYARIIYEQRHAPSFLEIADAEDMVIAVNSFSKSWAMTGWRLGWITGPPALSPVLEKLNEYNVASPSTASQYAGITAVNDGEEFISQMIGKYKVARDAIHQRLGSMSRVSMPKPDAAFYVFFRVEGVKDSRAFARQLLEQTKVGVAPGQAFGEGGDEYLRICYAKSPEVLGSALDRLAPVLNL